MEKIIKPRQTGKTTDLIEISEKTGIYILTADRKRAECVFRLSREQKRNIPYPVTLWEYQQSGFKGSFIRHLLIDDADAVLQELFKTVQIDALTMTGPEQHKVEDIKKEPISTKLMLMEANINGYAQGLKDSSKAEQEPKTGHWILADVEGSKVWRCLCSECNTNPILFAYGSEEWWLIKSNLPKYCPHCGARMVEPQERNDKNEQSNSITR